MPDDLISLSLGASKPPARVPFKFRLVGDAVGFVPVVTLTLIGINVALFALMEWAGGSTNNAVLIYFGAETGPLVEQGEYWRLLTSAFLHIGFAHLLFNMWALLALGSRLERILGPVRFSIVYFVSAIAGSILGLLMMPQAVEAGASGAIFGIAGAMLVLGVRDPKLLPEGVGKAFGPGIVPFLIYNLFYGALYNLVVASSTVINLAAHVGGALGGAGCALLLKPHSERPRTAWLTAGASVAATLLAYLLLLRSAPVRGLTLTQMRQNEKLQPVWALIQSGKIMQAQSEFQKLAPGANGGPDLHILRAVFLSTQNRNADALREYQVALQMAPNYPTAHRALGMALLRSGQVDEATAEEREAVRLDRSEANSHFLLAQTLLVKNATAEAIQELHLASQLNPQWPEPHRVLSVILSGLGKNDEAAAERAVAAKLDLAHRTAGR